MTHEVLPDPWPLRHLVLRTPRLELRPDDDQGLLELAEETHLGIHPPESMPFAMPWTDAPADEVGRNSLQHYWSQRAALRPDRWTVHFLVRHEGRVVGVQGLTAVDFAVTAEVETGSWIGLRHQRQGIGTEMRAAVLMLAFDHLGAIQARSRAFTDNAASAAVSRKLGYRPDGTLILARRGHSATEVRLLTTRDGFAPHRPPWQLQVTGLAGCLGLLGAGAAAQS